MHKLHKLHRYCNCDPPGRPRQWWHALYQFQATRHRTRLLWRRRQNSNHEKSQLLSCHLNPMFWFASLTVTLPLPGGSWYASASRMQSRCSQPSDQMGNKFKYKITLLKIQLWSLSPPKVHIFLWKLSLCSKSTPASFSDLLPGLCPHESPVGWSRCQIPRQSLTTTSTASPVTQAYSSQWV